MKKILSSLLLATAVSSAVSAAPFNGFYAGAEAGYARRNVENKLTGMNVNAAQVAVGGSNVTEGATSNVKLGDVKKTGAVNAFNYGLFGGYGVSSDSFYFGGEVHIAHSNANKAKKVDVAGATVAGGTAGSSGGSSGSLPGSMYTATVPASTVEGKYERGMSYGIAPRFGYVVGKDMLVFAKLGLEMSKDRGVWTTSSSTVKSRSKTKTVFVPGLGVEKAFGNLIARVAYEYNMGAKVTETVTNGAASLKYKEHRVKVGVAYAF